MIRRLIVTTILMASLAGCSGTIVSQGNMKKCLIERCEGVLYYPLQPSITKFYFDKIVDKDGKVLNWAGAAGSKRCIPVEVETVTMVPAPEPSLLSYEPGFLETSKFNVSLTPTGTLASVGAESTPGAKMATDALASLASSLKTTTESGVFGITSQVLPPYCSSGQAPVRPQLGPDQGPEM